MSTMMNTTRPREPRAVPGAPRENRSTQPTPAKPKVPATQAERLTQARIRAGYTSRKQAADALGEAEQSYHQREQGRRALTPAVAENYAKHFGVTPEWLLYGRTGMRMIPVRGIVGPDGTVLKGERIKAEVPAPPTDAGERWMPFVMRGRDLMPMCQDGDTIYVNEDVFNAPINRSLVTGRKCLVQTENGLTKVGVVISLGSDNRAVLHYPTGRHQVDVKLRKAAPVLWTKHEPGTSIVC